MPKVFTCKYSSPKASSGSDSTPRPTKRPKKLHQNDDSPLFVQNAYGNPAFFPHNNMSKSSAKAFQRRQFDISVGNDVHPYEEFSGKMFAYQRYNRNNRLIKKIFSENIVETDCGCDKPTDSKQKQIESLSFHQVRITNGLKKYVEKFEATKKQYEESNKKFEDAMETLSKPAVDSVLFEEMVSSIYESMTAFPTKYLSISSETPEMVNYDIIPTLRPDKESN